MTWSGLSAARGGGISSSLLLLITVLASLSNDLFVRSLPVNTPVVSSTPVVNDSLLVSSTPAINDSFLVSSLPVNTVYDMNNKMTKFMCEPQDRSYNLMDLMRSNGQLNESEEIRAPSYIVVKRCDSHAGCCSSSQKVCKVSEEPSSTYQVLAEILISSVGGSEKMKTIQIENHRKCRCTIMEYVKDREAFDATKPNVEFI